MIKFVIFDLDGTLVDTIGGIGNACNAVLEKEGYCTHPVESYKEFVGNGLSMTIYSALPEEVKDKMKGVTYVEEGGEPDFSHPILESYVNELVTYYHNNPIGDTKLYDGIEELLDTLKSKNIYWGIHTNKTYNIALQVAEAFFDKKDYIDLKGPDENTPRKPDPKGSSDLIEKVQLLDESINMENVLFVGDTEVDIKTAKKLGIKVAAVEWGFRKVDFLNTLDPDYLIKHPLDLLNIIE